jgi:hypothetical protein
LGRAGVGRSRVGRLDSEAAAPERRNACSTGSSDDHDFERDTRPWRVTSQELSMPAQVQTLLITGMPASGKTSFGDWLRDNRGYVHVDLDAADCLKTAGLPPFWTEKERVASLDTGRLREFVRHLRTVGKPSVLTWTFPTDLVDFTREMTSFGVVAWWFEADRLASRVKYASRNTVLRNGVYSRGKPDTTLFDRYVGAVNSNWARIAPIFGERIIRTLGADGRFVDPVSICDRLQVAAKAA